mmetsp:Transcript_12954/g.20065  ORF Transcript_12954/g.20065 Transcript_12954/m.20065 type:complete len:92 (-) Transcript_12954:986-1261(-)
MWDDDRSPSEDQFQQMLINNMEQVAKVFFKGVSIKRIKTNSVDGDLSLLGLTELNRRGMVESRIREDTGERQYHGGQIFTYLQSMIDLKQN